MTPIEQALTRVEAMSPSNPDVQAIVVALREALKDTARLNYLQSGHCIGCLMKPESHTLPIKESIERNMYHFQADFDDRNGYFETVRESIDAAMKDNK